MVYPRVLIGNMFVSPSLCLNLSADFIAPFPLGRTIVKEQRAEGSQVETKDRSE